MASVPGWTLIVPQDKCQGERSPKLQPVASRPLVCHLQVVLRQNPSPDPRTNAALRAGLASPELQEGSLALFLGRAHYGCVATLLPPSTAGLNRLVRPAPRASARLLSLAISCTQVLSGRPQSRSWAVTAI